jgi:hypothetical protein
MDGGAADLSAGARDFAEYRPEDYAKQDDSRVQIPTPQGLTPRPFDPL